MLCDIIYRRVKITQVTIKHAGLCRQDGARTGLTVMTGRRLKPGGKSNERYFYEAASRSWCSLRPSDQEMES